ncbi:MAG: alpha/beta hydrolase [Planctomycetes bacterium]|nr:alpha/beta hydrolase [Planctomycetota bacterium]
MSKKNKKRNNPPAPQKQDKAPDNKAGIEDLDVDASGRPPDRLVVFKKIASRELRLHVFEPDGLKPSDKRPAIVFFHGGAWRAGEPKQFYPQSRHLASQGMAAFCAEYRLTPEGVKVSDCVSDAKSAVRWIRRHAAELGVDPNRIAAGGGSAGGHLAAAAALTTDMDDPAEDLSISSKPNLLVLYNPALFHEFGQGTLTPKHVTKETPPAILMYGTDDEMIEYGRRFLEIAKEKGFHAELYAAEKAAHGFFNKSPWLESTTWLVHAFLARHGYVAAGPDGQPPQGHSLTKIGALPASR